MWELGIRELGLSPELDSDFRRCSSQDRALPLNLSLPAWEGSRLGRATPKYIQDILTEQRNGEIEKDAMYYPLKVM